MLVVKCPNWTLTECIFSDPLYISPAAQQLRNVISGISSFSALEFYKRKFILNVEKYNPDSQKDQKDQK